MFHYVQHDKLVSKEFSHKKMGSGDADFSKYPKPIIDHAFVLRRLKAFKEALAK